MTIAFLSPGDEDGVNPILEGFQQMERIHFAGAHEFYYTHIGRILHPHRARQVGGRVGTIVTTKGHYLGFKSLTHNPFLS